MKLKLYPLFLVLFAGTVSAQNNGNDNAPEQKVSVNSLGQTVITATPASFRIVTPSVHWNMIDSEDELAERKEMEDGRKEFYMEGYEEALLKSQNSPADPVVQKEMGSRKMRAPIVSFNGLSGSGLPPDPTGAAGTDYYVQSVNTSVRVYNKDGSAVPGGTFSLASLWSGSTNMGDPIVLYDRHADRWFISQFQQSPNRILIAISQTSDPLGNYYEYSFNMNQFPDYPKYSIWWDAYYMTSNSNQTAVAFERDAMISGNPSAQAVIMSLPGANSFGFKSPLPADADGDLPPAGTPCYFFNLEDDAMTGVSQDQIEVWEMTCDWTNTANTQVVTSQQIPLSSFNSYFSGGWSNIAQPGTSQGLDAIMGVIMFRAQHMRWTGYNTILLSFAANLGSNRSGIRWVELRDANDGNWTVYQEGTYAPDATKSRWMSSIGMDTWGNIGMGYSISDGSSTYPGLAYTGRLNGDNLGDMSYGEQIAIAGQSSQTFADRYGDYAHLSLDPDGKTFWYTGEYMGAGGNPKTRIFSFSIYDEAGLENPYYANLVMSAFQDASNLHVKVEGIHNNETVEMNVVAMNGSTVLSEKNVQPLNGALDKTMDISALQSGVYFVSVGNKNFQEVERIFIKH